MRITFAVQRTSQQPPAAADKIYPDARLNKVRVTN
jgi:hypothetical protein